MRLTTIKGRTAVLSSAVTVATVLLLIVVGSWQSRQFSAAANREVDALVDTNLDDVTRAARDLVRSQDEAVQQQVDQSLEVARHLAVQAGGIGVGEGVVSWMARNQFTSEERRVTLPRFEVGGEWFGTQTSFDVPMPLVDDIRDLVGGTVTVFQRMNDAGDMLRVATNVRTTDGTRAVGTYIPAIGPDGRPNVVVSTVLAGDTFRGNAYVVNAWYASAYEPLVDADGEVIGMGYVGVPQENVPSLRAGILAAQVGASGDVLVVGGSGTGRGEVRIAADAETGSSVLDLLDVDGVAYLDALIDAAVAAEPGGIVRARHTLPAGGEHVLRATWYEPWDWVVIATAPVSDFQAAHAALDDGRWRMMLWLIVTGLLAAVVLGGVAARWGADGIAGVVRRSASALQRTVGELSRLLTSSRSTADQAARASHASEQVAGNVASVAAAVEELDASVREIADHAAHASRVATDAVVRAQDASETVQRLDEASAEISAAVGLITSIAEQTNLLALNATIEAARAGDAGKGFAVVAGEVKQLANQTQDATARIGGQVQAIQDQTAHVVEAIESILTVIGNIADSQSTIASAVEEQSATSREIARSVTDAASGVADIAGSITEVAVAADQTTDVAREAREAALRLAQLADELSTLAGMRAPDREDATDPTDDRHPDDDRDQPSATTAGTPERGRDLVGV